jgi:Xaa-Pro aminopeptidase
MAGAQRLAYTPVVGGGPDATTIHYSRNDKPVRGTLVTHTRVTDG